MIVGTCFWFSRMNESNKPIKLCKNGSLCKFLHWTADECQEYICHKDDTAIEKIDCCMCKDGKTTFHVNDRSIKMECIYCHGKGYEYISRHESIKKKLIARDRNRIWCKCDQYFGTIYYKDNEHPRCTKHCYVCTRCYGITQIG